MSVRFLGKTVLFIGIFLFTIAMVGQPAFAGKWGGTPSEVDLGIEMVELNTGDCFLTITGRNLDNGDSLIISLAGTPLTEISESNSTTIGVEVPNCLSYVGDYLLSATCF